MDDTTQKENKPAVGKLTEHLGLLDKLSLNSPRSPLHVRNLGDSGAAPGTPQGSQKRVFLSARGNENSSPGTPKSSLDNGATSSKARGLFRSRKIGGFRIHSENSVLKTTTDFLLPAAKPKEISKNVVPSVTSKLPTAIADLFNKPILDFSMSPIAEDEEHSRVYKRFSGLGECKGLNDSFKRPSPPSEEYSGFQSKRAKSFHIGNMAHTSGNTYWSDEEEQGSSDHDKSFSLKIKSPLSPTSKLNRSQSESALCIKKAVERIDSDPTLVGDGSRSFILPVIHGKHNDLREISAATLISLFEGNYNGVVESYKVIDCRYPYEYDGGHIKSAINLHTQRQVFECFMKSKDPLAIGMTHEKREILIFHCEFSSQRGPDLCRYLRQVDRSLNETAFPSLHYPELYVLFGGYKSFFEQFKDYCIPQVYLPMVDIKYLGDCRMYKSMSKTDVVQLKQKPNSKTQKPSVRQASMKKLNLDSP